VTDEPSGVCDRVTSVTRTDGKQFWYRSLYDRKKVLVMAIKHMPSMCQNFTSLPRRFPLLRPSPPLSRRNPGTCLGRHRIACSCTDRMSMSPRLAAIPVSVRRAQRTYGTTDPGGVWHPVHRRECLTILLGTYAENGQCNRPTTTYIVFGTACLCQWQPSTSSL